MPQKKNLITKFLIWKYKHITNQQFIYMVSILIGLLSGLAAVTIKNLTHLIQQLLEGELIRNYHEAFYFIFPLIGILLTLLVIKLCHQTKSFPWHSCHFTCHFQKKRIDETLQNVQFCLNGTINSWFWGVCWTGRTYRSDKCCYWIECFQDCFISIKIQEPY